MAFSVKPPAPSDGVIRFDPENLTTSSIIFGTCQKEKPTPTFATADS